MNKEKHVGNLLARPGTVYQFTEITGSVDASGADTKTAFPKLTSVGGSVDARGDFTKVKSNDVNARGRCAAMLMEAFAAAGFSFADGILSRVVSRRGNVARVIVCGKTEITYVVTDSESHSHGATLREARDGLLYKIGSRDTSEFKSWTLDRVVTKRDGIRAYRAITGACEAGVRGWLEQHQVAEKISIGGIIKLTNGAYGSQQFAAFFNK